MQEQARPDVESNAQTLDSLMAETAILNQSTVQRADVGSLVANTSGVGAVQAETVTVETSGVGTVQAERAEFHLSGVGLARSDDLTASQVIAGAMLTLQDARLEQCASQVIAAGGDAAIERSVSGVTVVGGNATLNNTYSLFLVAAGGVKAEGQIHTVFDPQSARSVGIVFSVVVGLFWLLRALLKR